MNTNSKFDTAKNNISLVNLNDIFDGSRVFRIPDFQRGYAWEKSQREDLWKDLISLPSSNKHYTGMFTLQEGDDNNYNEEGIDNESYTLYYVIDGQQRLTSTLILLSTLIQYANENNIILEENTTNNSSLTSRFFISHGLHFFDYSSTRQDNDETKVIKSILTNTKLPNINPSYYTTNLINAKEEFKDHIENYLNQHPNTPHTNLIREIFDKVVNSLIFNIYFVTESFDIHTTFETINNRGKVLSSLELLKNRLLYLTNHNPIKHEGDSTRQANKQEIINLRKTINDKWGSIYKNLGLSETLLDDNEFLKGHWLYYYGNTKDKGEKYKNDLLNNQFSNLKTPDYDNIITYCNSLEEASKFWSYIYYPYTIPAEDNIQGIHEQLDKLARLETPLYVKTYLISILKEINANNIDAIRTNLDNLARFIFIRKYIGSTIKADYMWLVTKAHDLKESNLTIVDCINSVNKTLLYDKPYGIDVQEIKEQDIKDFTNHMNKLFSDEHKGYYEWQGIAYLLYEYNLSLATQSGRPNKFAELNWNKFIKKDKKNQLSIEHIYPQSPTAYWNECFKDYNDTERKKFANSLGNLLPLSQSINSQFQNDCFHIKCEGIDELNNKDNLNIDKAIRTTCYAQGTLSEIEVSKIKDLSHQSNINHDDNEGSNNSQPKAIKHWLPTNIVKRSQELLEWMNTHWHIGLSKEDIDELVFAVDKKTTINKNELNRLALAEIDDKITRHTHTQSLSYRKTALTEDEFFNQDLTKQKMMNLAKFAQEKIREYIKSANYEIEISYTPSEISFKIPNVSKSRFAYICSIRKEKICIVYTPYEDQAGKQKKGYISYDTSNEQEVVEICKNANIYYENVLNKNKK